MSINAPQFPNWDGSTPNRIRRDENRSPDFEDWDQIIAETLQYQTEINNLMAGSFTAVNSEGSTMIPGQVVRLDTDGTVKLADADVAIDDEVAGLVEVGAINGQNVTIRYSGILTLTLAEWDAVGTDAAGLDPSLVYLLSDIPGEITTIPPATASDTLYRLGKALSATSFLINLEYDNVVPAATAAVGTFTGTNQSGLELTPGMVAVFNDSGDIDFADMNHPTAFHLRAMGFIEVGATDGNVVTVRHLGIIVATEAEWNAVDVSAGSTGLIPGAQYWSWTTVGTINRIPPSVSTQTIYRVGKAKSTTEMVINLEFDGIVP